MDEADLAQETTEDLPKYVRNDEILEAVTELTALMRNLIEGQIKTLSAVNKVFSKMEKIESEAADMASPEKLMELAGTMMNGFGGGGSGRVLG